MSQVDISKLFHQAWIELYSPPVRLTLDERKDQFASPAPLSVTNGIIHLKPGIVPRGCDYESFLLSVFRHELAHVHHCPYDVRTAYSLEKAAYEVILDWDLSYLATHVFADMEVNLNYLLRRFKEFPYFMKAMGVPRESLAEEMAFEVYNQIEPVLEPKDKAVTEAARETFTIMRLNKPWHIKVQMLAIILGRLKSRRPRLFSGKKVARFMRERPLIVREDFHFDTLKMFEETYGMVTNENEAREFFKHWVEPRLSEREKEALKEMLKKKVKTKQQLLDWEKEKQKTDRGTDSGKTDQSPGKEPSTLSLGKEPRLPTYLSKAYGKISPQKMNEAIWRRYWYKSRAENTIIRYLSESLNPRPVWSVMKYPDEWYIEDEIEALDIEMSLDEGPLMPEVNTLKWVEEPALEGQSVMSGFVPSSITVLDASQSMLKVHDLAAIAAFIVYLSALKAGGETSTLTFSTNYLAADWNDPGELKDLTLSMSFDEYTIFPAFEVMKLVSATQGNCLVVIITDGGWQNIDESIPLLESISDQGHKVLIFQLPGGEYPDRIERIKRSPHIMVHKVVNPEADLQDLVLTETMKTYKAFLT